MSLERTCCGIVANPYFLVFSFKSVAGIASTKDPSLISQNILGNYIPSGNNKDTDSPMNVATIRCKKYLCILEDFN